jgi:hypothetical protein
VSPSSPSTEASRAAVQDHVTSSARFHGNIHDLPYADADATPAQLRP